jgi:hypothetical protein
VRLLKKIIPKQLYSSFVLACLNKGWLKSIEIPVRQEHIDKGRPTVSEFCPIALAIEDELNISARVGIICVTLDSVPKVYKLDDIGYTFRRNFDCGKPVQPTTIRITRC